MKYIVELEFDKSIMTEEELEKGCAEVDSLFQEEDVSCFLKTDSSRVYIKEKQDRDSFVKVWACLARMRKRPEVFTKLKKATWEDDDKGEKGDLIKEFFYRRKP